MPGFGYGKQPVSTSTQHPPIPRQPIGATFVVAISILGAFAVIQFLAIAAHYYPMIRQQVANSALQSQRTVLDQTPIPLPSPMAASAQSRTQSASLADDQKIQKLFAKADRDYEVGDFDNALKSVEDIEAILPGDPSMLLRKARVLEQLEQPQQAMQALKETLMYKGLSRDDRDKTERKIEQLAQTINNTPAPAIPRALPNLESSNGNDLTDSSVQPGATLGIVDAQLSDGKDGTKHLKVAVKARKGVKVNVPDVKVMVYFYETTDDGDVTLTESKVVSMWMSPPVDWANDEPEILDLQYTSPNPDTAPGKKYYGYIVGVYYNKELQAFRSEPAKLSSDSPLPLYQKEDSN